MSDLYIEALLCNIIIVSFIIGIIIFFIKIKADIGVIFLYLVLSFILTVVIVGAIEELGTYLKIKPAEDFYWLWFIFISVIIGNILFLYFVFIYLPKVGRKIAEKRAEKERIDKENMKSVEIEEEIEWIDNDVTSSNIKPANKKPLQPLLHTNCPYPTVPQYGYPQQPQQYSTRPLDICPECGRRGKFSNEYQEYYCWKCKKYFDDIN